MSTKSGKQKDCKIESKGKRPPEHTEGLPEGLARQDLAANGARRVLDAASGGLRPEEVLALQGTIGNLAVQRWMGTDHASGIPDIQREGDSRANQATASGHTETGVVQLNPPDMINEEMFAVSNWIPRMNGYVTAAPDRTGESVRISAPEIFFQAMVSTTPGTQITEGRPIQVGVVQELLGSDRTAIYRRNGDPRGEVLGEHHTAASNMRDARMESRGGQDVIPPEPWYYFPSSLDFEHSRTTVTYRDQPSITVPIQLGEGSRLTEVRGQDRFITSIAAKRGEFTEYLTSYEWQIPWNMRINTRGQGVGQELTGDVSTTEPTTTTGPIPLLSSESWYAFPNAAAAATANTDILLQSLVPTRQLDPSSYEHIVDALRRRNPTLQVSVRVDTPADWFTDEIEIMARGSRAVVSDPLASVSSGGLARFSVQLLQLFPDMANITERSQIEFRVRDRGMVEHEPAFAEWPYPFYIQDSYRSMRGSGEGSYEIAARFLNTGAGGG